MKPFIPSWLNQAGLPQSDFRVYCCLISRADNATGIAWPKADTIAADCMMARNTVWKALRALEGRQLIRRVGKPFQGSSRYQILMPTGANETLVDGATNSNETPVAGSTSANEMPIESPTSANETPPIGANEILQSAQIRRRECNPKNVIQGRKTESELFKDFPSERKSKARGTLEELKAFAEEIGLPASDGEFMFDHWSANGWKNGSNPSQDWRAGIRKWRTKGWLPSQTLAVTNGGALRNSPLPAPAGTVIVNGRAFKS